jgi:hypothetical protein
LKIWLFSDSFYVQQAVSADIIPNSAVGIFSPKTEGTKTQAARITDKLVTGTTQI